MDTEEKSRKQFRVVKYWVHQYLRDRITYITMESYSVVDISKKIGHKSLEDARCLLRMMVKECEAHDTRVKTQETLLNKLTYSREWQKSRVFHGIDIPTREIDRLIEKYPTTDEYEIYRHLMGHIDLSASK